MSPLNRRPPRSTLHEARRRLVAEIPRRVRVRRAFSQLGGSATGILLGPWAPALYAPLLILLPVPDRKWGVERDFAGPAWQVEAAVVGISVAFMVFAFQAVTGGERRVTLGEFVRFNKLESLLHFALGSVLAGGLVFAAPPPFGLDRARGERGAIVLGLTLLAVTLFVRTTLRALEPSSLHRFRVAQLTGGVAQAVRRHAERLVARGILREYADDHNFTFIPYLGKRRTDHDLTLTARASGQVADIRLRRLDRTMKRHALGSRNAACLQVELGRWVNAGDPIIVLNLPDGSSGARPLPRGVLVLRAPADDRGRTAANGLHDEMLAAIHLPTTTWLHEVAEAYVELLLAYPKEWQGLDQAFTPEVARSEHPLGFSVLDEISENLQQALEQAVRADRRDAAFVIVDIARAVVPHAIPLSGEGLADEMFDLLRRLRWTATKAPASELREEVGKRAWRGIVDSLKYHCDPTTGLLRDADASRVAVALEVAMRGSVQLRNLMKDLVDEGDHAQLAAVDRAWAELFSRDSDADYPGEESDEAGVSRQLENLREARAMGRFHLLAWSLHRLAQEPGDEGRAKCARVLLDSAGSTSRLFEIVSAANLGAGDTFTNWILFEREEGAGSFDSYTPQLRALAIVLLARTPAEGAIDLPATDWLADRGDRLCEIVRTLTEDGRLWGALYPGVAPRNRADALVKAIEAGASTARHEREEAVVDTPIPEARVAELEALTEESLREQGAARVLFQMVGAYHEGDWPERPDDDGWFGPPDSWVPKTMIDSESSRRFISEDSGRSIARGELDRLLIQWGSESGSQATEAGVDGLVEAAQEMRRDSYQPSVILVPPKWQFLIALESSPRWSEIEDVTEFARAIDEAGLSSPGLLDDIPIVVVPRLGKDAIIADIARWGVWDQAQLSESGGIVRVRVRTFDEAEARERCAKDPDLFREAASEGIEDRAWRLQQNAVLAVRTRWDLDVKDTGAVRRVRVLEIDEGS